MERNKNQNSHSDEKEKKNKKNWQPIKFTFVAHLNELVQGGKTVVGTDGDMGPKGMTV